MFKLFLDLDRTTEVALIVGHERRVCVEGERHIRAGWARNQFMPRMYLKGGSGERERNHVLQYLTGVMVELEDETRILNGNHLLNCRSAGG